MVTASYITRKDTDIRTASPVHASQVQTRPDKNIKATASSEYFFAHCFTLKCPVELSLAEKFSFVQRRLLQLHLAWNYVAFCPKCEVRAVIKSQPALPSSPPPLLSQTPGNFPTLLSSSAALSALPSLPRVTSWLVEATCWVDFPA